MAVDTPMVCHWAVLSGPHIEVLTSKTRRQARLPIICKPLQEYAMKRFVVRLVLGPFYHWVKYYRAEENWVVRHSIEFTMSGVVSGFGFESLAVNGHDIQSLLGVLLMTKTR